MKPSTTIYVYLNEGEMITLQSVIQYSDEDYILWVATEEGEFVVPLTSVKYIKIRQETLDNSNLSTT